MKNQQYAPETGQEAEIRHVWTALLWQGVLDIAATLVGAAMCSTF
jgi:hypothetical protein